MPNDLVAIPFKNAGNVAKSFPKKNPLRLEFRLGNSAINLKDDQKLFQIFILSRSVVITFWNRGKRWLYKTVFFFFFFFFKASKYVQVMSTLKRNLSNEFLAEWIGGNQTATMDTCCVRRKHWIRRAAQLLWAPPITLLLVPLVLVPPRLLYVTLDERHGSEDGWCNNDARWPTVNAVPGVIAAAISSTTPQRPLLSNCRQLIAAPRFLRY